MYARDHALIATPMGPVRIDGDESSIASIKICAEGPATRGSAAAVEQLEQWLAGERQEFDLPLEPAATWRGAELRAALIAVPYGRTLSYGDFARRNGSAPRAVGQLCARNPFPIVVPCHRILGSGGALGHYSGGEGSKTKIWLLDHERRHRPSEGTLL